MKNIYRALSIAVSFLMLSTTQLVLAEESEAKLVLTFLGTGAPRPSLDRYGPSILVEAGDDKIIVDAGSGMRERLFQAGGFKLLTGVDKILVTHLHFDHTISIPGLWLSGWLFGRRVPMQVYGPTGTEKMMKHLKRAYKWDIDYREIVGVPIQGSEMQTKDVGPGVFYDKNGLKITAFEVEHMPVNFKTGEKLDFRGQTLGFRIDYKGRSVLFSGDTHSTPESKIIEYGKNVDVLIHEVQVPSPGNSAEAKLANVSLKVHSSPKETAYILSQTRPRLGVYSHIIPPEVTREDLMAATTPHYGGALTVANDLMTITIGDEIKIGQREEVKNEVFEKSRVLK